MIRIIVSDYAVFNRRIGVLAEYTPAIFVGVIVFDSTMADQWIGVIVAVDPTAVTSRSRVASQVILNCTVTNDGAGRDQTDASCITLSHQAVFQNA